MTRLCIEDAIQSATIYWVHETYPEIMITTTSNEKHYKNTRHIGSKGITDLILFYTPQDVTHILFLELKKKKGKLLPSQREWNAKFDLRKYQNAERAVAYGFNAAINIIGEWAKELNYERFATTLTESKTSPTLQE